jgi:translation initiation factor eIF-2B subunit gamma
MGAVLPTAGLQALILCGPGTSFGTLLDQEKTPKCLALIANRPMIYYPLKFCMISDISSELETIRHRSAFACCEELLIVSDVTLIAPPSALASIKSALQQNPYLKSLPMPKVVAPQDLQPTMATAQLLRLPEVQSCIISDFFLLPCDLVCEIEGTYLLKMWMASQGQAIMAEENRHRRGGLCMYYRGEDAVKDESLNLIAIEPARSSQRLSKLLMSIGMDTVKRNMERDKGFLLRQSFTKRQATQAKMLTGYRDAHLYIFPYWVKDLARRQERLESISEDLIGLWAKSAWQRGLHEKLGMNTCLSQQKESQENDYRGLSTITHQPPRNHVPEVPPLLAYLHTGSTPLVRRVDNPALLLSTSLRLAKLGSTEDAGHTAPFAHDRKIVSPDCVAANCFISKDDCLLGSNVVVERHSVIKESCIGPNTKICSGARITRCVILDGVVIGERCVLTGCIVGSRSHIGNDSVLKDCEVQEGNVVPEETEATNEKFMPLFEDLEEDTGIFANSC